MINSVTELKDLILWLKSEKVKSLRIGEIHVELSDYALLESFADETVPAKTEATPAQENWTEEVSPAADKVDDEDLFWSTR